MPRPTAYERLADFIDYAVNHPSAPYNPADHDEELDAIVLSIGEVIGTLNGITRDDGKLKNQSVSIDALTPTLLASLTAIRQPSQYAGAWSADRQFKFADLVTDGFQTYFCAIPHVSSLNLATDVAAGRWLAIGVRVGGSGGVAVLDENELLPQVIIPLLDLSKIPQLPISRIDRFTYEATIDIGDDCVLSKTVTLAVPAAVTTDKIVASVTAKVGDTLNDELEMEMVKVSARCAQDGAIIFNMASDVFIKGQYEVTYLIL